MGRVKGDVATERAVLAGICKFGSEAMMDVEDIIETTTFTDEANQLIFSCLKTALDNTTVVDQAGILAAASQLKLYDVITEKSNLEFIRGLFLMPVKKEAIRKHAAKMKKLEIAAKIQAELEEAHRELSEVTGTESINDILGITEGRLFDFTTKISDSSSDRPKLLFGEAEEYLEYLSENPVDMVGIQTPFKYYDTAIGGGLRAGSVNLIVARPKTGKTTVAKTMALDIARNEFPVLVLDTEMNMNDLLHRSLADATNVMTNDIETGKFGQKAHEKTKLIEFVKSNRDLPFYYQGVAGKPFNEVLSIMRRWVVKEVGLNADGKCNPCVIIYDYFKLMDTSDLDKMQEYQAMGYQINDLTNFCNQYGPSCLAFVQANRQGIDKESTDIISQSDRLLWLCGSASFLRRKSLEEIAQEGLENGNMKLIIMESRYGAGLGDDWINLNIDGNYSRITELGTYTQSQQSGNKGFDTETVDDDDESCPFDPE